MVYSTLHIISLELPTYLLNKCHAAHVSSPICSPRQKIREESVSLEAAKQKSNCTSETGVGEVEMEREAPRGYRPMMEGPCAEDKIKDEMTQ